MRKLFKNHNAIFQCNPINNSSNTVVLRFGCLSRGHLKPEINYSLSGVSKDHSADRFLLKLIQCLMTYLKFSTIWWFCCVFICCMHRWLENKITHLPPRLVSSAPSGPEAGQLKHQAAKSPPHRVGPWVICLRQNAAGHCPSSVFCLGLFAIPCGGGRKLRLCLAPAWS